MELNTCLNQYYESKIKINRSEREAALEVWQKLVKEILDEVERVDARFSLTMLYTGSFYERMKTQSPDEFDLMLVLDKIQPEIKNKVVVHGFTFIYISEPERSRWNRDRIVDSEGKLNAVQMRAVFSRLVVDAVRKIQGNHSGKKISISTHGPAVTLNIDISETRYDVDLTLAIKLPTWPKATKTWKERTKAKGWPNENVMRTVHQGGCHVVAKQPKKACDEEMKKFLWRFSFSVAEKTIMKSMDAGIANSGRRRVAQILKMIVSNDPHLQSMPLTSYHIKTLIFWESENHPEGKDWDGSKLQDRFHGAVDKMLTYLKKKSYPHYFLNQVNLVENFKESHFNTVSKKFEEIKKDPITYFR